VEYHYLEIKKYMNMLLFDNQHDDENMKNMKSFLDEMLRQIEM
jgi:hypothetical protein